MPSDQKSDRARELIRAAGRVTKPRVRTLTALLTSDRALSHGELRAQMPDLDRVSLYRTLEWLLEHGLAFRIGTDGQHRYGASQQQHHHQHPHFQCSACGVTRCLDDVTSPVIRLPKGFRLNEVEMVAKGLCNACAASSE